MSFRSLGVSLHPTLTHRKHISNICKTAYFELRRISSIRHYFSVDATKTLVCSFVLSRLEYCNSLLAGSPKYLFRKLQKIKNNAARMICRSSKFDHVSPLLQAIHLLPIHQRINYKLSSLCFSSCCFVCLFVFWLFLL